MGSPRNDLHAAAALLYGELAAAPWFVGLVVDEASGTVIVEAHDVRAADVAAEWFGWAVQVREWRGMIRNAI